MRELLEALGPLENHDSAAPLAASGSWNSGRIKYIYLSFFNYHLSRVYISEGLIPLQNIFHSLSFNFTGNEAVSPSESGVGDGDGIPTPGNSGREVLDNFKFVVQNLSM